MSPVHPVYSAVAARRSCRAFSSDPVDAGLIDRVLEAALRAPSGGNLQPWHFALVTGSALDRLKAGMAQTVQDRPQGDTPDYDIYPPGLVDPYRQRRFEVGEDLYGALGISRDNKIGRLMWLTQNFQFFGAPVGLFCFVDKRMGRPQWSDLGMILQTIMLLFEAEGVATCAQEAWSRYGRTVHDFVGAPDEHILFCGMAIGYSDDAAPANQFRSRRAPLSDVLTRIDD